MSLINNIFAHFYDGYKLSKSDIVKYTGVPYHNIRNRVINPHQEEKLCTFYYDIELIHSLLRNTEYAETSQWFFSKLSENIPYSPADFYLREGIQSVINIIITSDSYDYIEQHYPQYIKKHLEFSLPNKEFSLVMNYRQFSA